MNKERTELPNLRMHRIGYTCPTVFGVSMAMAFVTTKTKIVRKSVPSAFMNNCITWKCVPECAWVVCVIVSNFTVRSDRFAATCAYVRRIIRQMNPTHFEISFEIHQQLHFCCPTFSILVTDRLACLLPDPMHSSCGFRRTSHTHEDTVFN